MVDWSFIRFRFLYSLFFFFPLFYVEKHISGKVFLRLTGSDDIKSFGFDGAGYFILLAALDEVQLDVITILQWLIFPVFISPHSIACPQPLIFLFCVHILLLFFCLLFFFLQIKGKNEKGNCYLVDFGVFFSVMLAHFEI